MAKHFGEHLMIDGYGGSRDKLDNRELVFSLLNDLPGKINMKKLARPVVYAAPPTGKKDPGGWSGFVVIAESHISLHTFPKKGFLSADVYTCQNGMDTGYIVNIFKKAFSLKKIEQNFVKRGLNYQHG